ncbi:hypothetical protein J6590_049990 [Homalodisca vitripennis]|nr:hypothetical protein J6590_049990 [Homalodisca vitripennis]
MSATTVHQRRYGNDKMEADAARALRGECGPSPSAQLLVSVNLNWMLSRPKCHGYENRFWLLVAPTSDALLRDVKHRTAQLLVSVFADRAQRREDIRETAAAESCLGSEADCFGPQPQTLTSTLLTSSALRSLIFVCLQIELRETGAYKRNCCG